MPIISSLNSHNFFTLYLISLHGNSNSTASALITPIWLLTTKEKKMKKTKLCSLTKIKARHWIALIWCCCHSKSSYGITLHYIIIKLVNDNIDCYTIIWPLHAWWAWESTQAMAMLWNESLQIKPGNVSQVQYLHSSFTFSFIFQHITNLLTHSLSIINPMLCCVVTWRVVIANFTLILISSSFSKSWHGVSMKSNEKSRAL